MAIDIEVRDHQGVDVNVTVQPEVVAVTNYGISGVPPVTAADNGKIMQVVNGAWQAVLPEFPNSGDVDTTLTKSGVAADAKTVGDALRKIDETVADMLYEPIAVQSLSISPSTVEMGSTVDNLVLNWSLNKDPVSQTVRGKRVANSLRSIVLTDLGLMKNETFELRVADERGAVALDSRTLQFLNGVYYGTLSVGTVIDSAAILSMTRSLQSSKAKTFTATAGAGQKFTYALPSRYGTPAFNVGGFDYVWTKAATFDFANASGYTEEYDVWMNDEVVVGTRTIKVT